jgi:hypothetical protein
VTRYVVDLDAGGQLVAVRQNLEPARNVLEAQGHRVRLAWDPEQSIVVEGESTSREEGA